MALSITVPEVEPSDKAYLAACLTSVGARLTEWPEWTCDGITPPSVIREELRLKLLKRYPDGLPEWFRDVRIKSVRGTLRGC